MWEGKKVSIYNVINKTSKSCGCEKQHLRKGYKEISGTFWCNFKNNAKKRNINLYIDLEYVWDLFLKQNKKCVLSGEILTFKKDDNNYYTASLDRINSKKGYIKENVQWVSKEVNYMKGDLSEEEFISICRIITKNSKFK